MATPEDRIRQMRAPSFSGKMPPGMRNYGTAEMRSAGGQHSSGQRQILGHNPKTGDIYYAGNKGDVQTVNASKLDDETMKTLAQMGVFGNGVSLSTNQGTHMTGARVHRYDDQTGEMEGYDDQGYFRTKSGYLNRASQDALGTVNPHYGAAMADVAAWEEKRKKFDEQHGEGAYDHKFAPENAYPEHRGPDGMGGARLAARRAKQRQEQQEAIVADHNAQMGVPRPAPAREQGTPVRPATATGRPTMTMMPKEGAQADDLLTRRVQQLTAQGMPYAQAKQVAERDVAHMQRKQELMQGGMPAPQAMQAAGREMVGRDFAGGGSAVGSVQTPPPAEGRSPAAPAGDNADLEARFQEQQAERRRDTQIRLESGQGFANVEQQGAMFQDGAGLRRGIAAQEAKAQEAREANARAAESARRTEEMRKASKARRDAGYPDVGPEERARLQARDRSNDAFQAMLDRERWVKDNFRRYNEQYTAAGVTEADVIEKYDEVMKGPGTRLEKMRTLRGHPVMLTAKVAKDATIANSVKARKAQENTAMRLGVPVGDVVIGDSIADAAKRGPEALQGELYRTELLRPGRGYGNAGALHGKSQADKEAAETVAGSKKEKPTPSEALKADQDRIAALPINPAKLEQHRLTYIATLGGAQANPIAENQHIVRAGATDARTVVEKTRTGAVTPDEAAFLQQWTNRFKQAGYSGDNQAQYLAWTREMGIPDDMHAENMWYKLTGGRARTIVQGWWNRPGVDAAPQAQASPPKPKPASPPPNAVE